MEICNKVKILAFVIKFHKCLITNIVSNFNRYFDTDHKDKFKFMKVFSLNSGNKTDFSKIRSSNLEFYRIICMLMIVAHHFVVNSGLMAENGPMVTYNTSTNTLFLYVFGMWGKTGINCFLMITGYFMCKSQITLRKFLKLLLWIYVYKIIIFVIFATKGSVIICPTTIFHLLSPVSNISYNFIGCFLCFYLTIPFWNILLQHISKQQHQLLIVLLLGMYTIIGSIPKYHITFNYVSWFGVIYVLSSYIRLYPNSLFERRRFWAGMSIICIIMAIASVFFTNGSTYYVSDSNKIFAVLISVSTFLWVKNINIPYSKFINTIGSSTFGVLLIHDNSPAMRQWLWRNLLDCVGHFELPLWQFVGFSVISVVTVFTICICIDIIRIKIIEQPIFSLYDKYTN